MVLGIKSRYQLASPMAEQRLGNYISRGIALRQARTARIQARNAGLKETGGQGTL